MNTKSHFYKSAWCACITHPARYRLPRGINIAPGRPRLEWRRCGKTSHGLFISKKHANMQHTAAAAMQSLACLLAWERTSQSIANKHIMKRTPCTDTSSNLRRPQARRRQGSVHHVLLPTMYNDEMTPSSSSSSSPLRAEGWHELLCLRAQLGCATGGGRRGGRLKQLHTQWHITMKSIF